MEFSKELARLKKRKLARLKKRIGTVRLWPNQPSAEVEVIERLGVAAKKIGFELVVCDRNGELLDEPGTRISSANVDFVINLHFDSPKNYDCFSFGALWNPLAYYYAFGFERSIGNQLSHDDFLTCGARPAEDVVLRARPEIKREELATLNHSMCDPIIEPRMRTDRVAFYCGINWERISNKHGRFHELLRALDEKDKAVLYGPDDILGVHPWEGYRNYKGPIPFDGRSIVHAAAEAGAVLVLSSEAHIQSGVMSNRFFEALAAGALIIGDSHPFLREHLPGSYIAIDDTLKLSDQVKQVIAALKWANENPNETFDMISRAQEVFRSKFLLDQQLLAICQQYVKNASKAGLLSKIRLSILFIPLAEEEELKRSLGSLDGQDVDIVIAIRSIDECKNINGVRFVAVGDLIDAPISKFGAIVARLVQHAQGEAFCVCFGFDHFFSNFAQSIGEAIFPTNTDVVCIGSLVRTTNSAKEVGVEYVAPLQAELSDAARISSVIFRRSAYESKRPFLDYLGMENWVRVVRDAAQEKVISSFPPQSIVHSDNLRTKLQNLVESKVLSGKSQEEQLLRYHQPYGLKKLKLKRLSKANSMSLSSSDFAAIPRDKQTDFAIAVFRALPFPRSFFALLKGLHRFYRVIRRPSRHFKGKWFKRAI